MNTLLALGLHACFGLELLGMCKYDPQAPSPSYFTIGDAVAALAFTLAVQQFLKPIYRFRLIAMGIRFSYLVCTVFIGALFTIIAAIVPNIPILRETILGYPLNWEISAGIVIGVAYAIVAIISLRPAKLSKRNVKAFTWAGTELLSHATDEDRLSLSKDVMSGMNIQKLFQFTAEYERADWHATMIEFENLREQGREGEGVIGRPDICAFYAFAHRRELQLADYAWHFLHILSDRDFCRVVITRDSWRFLRAINALTELKVSTEAANAFVQAVAWQALVQDDGMLAKEVGYEGFGHSREFAREFFGNYKLHVFDPLGGTSSISTYTPSIGFVSRLNIASTLMVSAEVEKRGFWESQSTMRVVDIYENVCHSVSYARSENKDLVYLSELRRGITDLSKIMSTSLERTDPRTYNLLFAQDLVKYRHDSVDRIASLISESLICISNRFQGLDDKAWFFAHEIWDCCFERFGDVPMGLSPLQQAVAIKLIDKLKDNMDGYYPTLSCVLLSMIGPYKTNLPEKPNSAAAIIKNAIYFELKRLPDLYKKSPEKIAERLPTHVTYNHTTRSLVHTYRGGQQVITKLTSLRISKIDLLSEKYLHRRG